MKINEVIKNMMAIKMNECDTIEETERELRNEIIVAFEDYSFEGITEIMVDFDGNRIYAYANHINAPVFILYWKNSFQVITIKNVEVTKM